MGGIQAVQIGQVRVTPTANWRRRMAGWSHALLLTEMSRRGLARLACRAEANSNQPAFAYRLRRGSLRSHYPIESGFAKAGGPGCPPPLLL